MRSVRQQDAAPAEYSVVRLLQSCWRAACSMLLQQRRCLASRRCIAPASPLSPYAICWRQFAGEAQLLLAAWGSSEQTACRNPHMSGVRPQLHDPERAFTSPRTAQDMSKRGRAKIPEEAYKDGPDGLKLYDVKLGDGALAQVGSAQLLPREHLSYWHHRAHYLYTCNISVELTSFLNSNDCFTSLTSFQTSCYV